jgi:protoporphyrinogen oxidase
MRNEGLGYNSTFRYPKRGGIEIVPEAFSKALSTVRLEARVRGVDLNRRTVTLASGETIAWTRLVVTIPLPAFLGMVEGGGRDARTLGARLDWSIVGCLNLGFDRAGIGDGAHWIYVPDGDAPFYRVGFPHAMSSSVAPPGTSSAYVEFGLRRGEEVDPVSLETAALAALRREGLLREGDRVIARDFIRIDPGYVIFDRARQEVLAEAVPWLEGHGVRLIGRYGAWTYSYMERAMLDGLEAAEALRAES